MPVFTLALKSLYNRKVTVSLTIISIALSVALFLGVERVRHEAQSAFTNTVSGTDLIIGARTSPVQLLLASVFRLSDMSNNISHHSFEEIASLPQVKWAIPVSLGDTHAGFRVLGTNSDYYTHLQFGNRQHLRLSNGEWFQDASGAVLGAEVADTLDYGIGTTIIVSHGTGEISFLEHGHHPFTVTGILERTGTPVDRTVHVSLNGINAIHRNTHSADEQLHDPLTAAHTGHVNEEKHDGETTITALFIGLHSRTDVLGLQRTINEYKQEPLTGVIPTVALQQLWQIVGGVEKSLLALSGFVVMIGLIGMMVAIMTSLNDRRREMAILRAVGARPAHILGLIVGEAAIIAGAGVILGVAILYGLLIVVRPIIGVYFGLYMAIGAPSVSEIAVVLAMCLAGVLIGLVPGYRIYRFSLADGMTVKL